MIVKELGRFLEVERDDEEDEGTSGATDTTAGVTEDSSGNETSSFSCETLLLIRLLNRL